jgi:hypothetical protein
MPAEPESADTRRKREEDAERVRHAFRSDPEFMRLLKESKKDEQAGRFVSLDEVLRQHPPASE